MKLKNYLWVCFLCSTFFSFAQTKSVSGTVSDTSGVPLPGASVLIKNSTDGTTTDFDGNFTINVPPDAVLMVSYIGYRTLEIPVGSETEFQIVLEEDTEALAEVVVIGYGTSTKRALTSAVTVLKSADVIEDKPFSDVGQSLNGKLAGVQVIEASGSPGASPSIRIRGANSLSASVEPLYIIDGVQVTNTEALNPNDVESISILKDAAASSIYGARAANGVVLITTKRGTKGKSAINFSTFIGEDRVINTLKVLNSQQYIDYLNTARINAGEPPIADPFNSQFNTDWQRELYAPATLQNYQLSFTGGSEKGSYYLSAGLQDEQGTIETTGFKRYSVRFNQDSDLYSNLKVGNSIALSRTEFNVINDNNRVNQGGVVLSALQTPPIIPIRNEDGSFAANPFQGGFDNPIALIQGENREFNTSKVIANVYGEYTFPFGLVFRSSFGVDYTESKFNRFADPFSTSNGRANEGLAETSTNLQTVWLWENTLNYKFEPIKDVAMDFLFGTAAQQSKFENTRILGVGFPNGSITNVDAASEILDTDEIISEWSNNSFFLRTNISFLDRYFFSSTVRRDGSSRFGPDNKFAIFPSVSTAWVVSEEDFLKNTSWLNTLKLRYSYGVTGNQEIGDYEWQGLYGLNANYFFNGEVVPGVFPSQVENRNLKWESTEQHNLGLDIGLIDNKVTINIDAYQKNTFDLLIPNPLPASTGFREATQNIGSLTNKGIEIGVNAILLSTDDFSWDINANYTKNENEVTDINGQIITGGGVNDQGDVTRIEENQPIGNFFGFVSEGIDPATGDVIFRDLNNDGIIDDENDRTIIGNALPDFSWGATTNIGYKGLQLTAFFQGVEGQDIYNASRFELENQATFKNQSITVLDRWTPNNTNTTIPRAVFGDPSGNGRASSRWVEDGSFIKLRELTLAYTFPKSIIEKLKMTNLKIYVQGRNLYTWTDYTGYDPEVSRDQGNVLSTNIDYGTYPQVKTYIAGLNVTF
ncbi:MAG: TonB-dependent receptor [Saonia sp.]